MLLPANQYVRQISKVNQKLNPVLRHCGIAIRRHLLGMGLLFFGIMLHRISY